MKTKWMAPVILVGILMTGGSLFAQSRFSVGIGIGSPGYYAPPVVAYRPPYPGPGYYWVDGYYDPYGSWIAGYWAPPAYGYGYGYGYVAPRYYSAPRYYGGYNRGYYGGGYRRGFDRGDFRGRQNFRGGRGGGNGRGEGHRR
jgi:hypothetical protein